MCSVISSVLVSHHVMLFFENDKKCSTPVCSTVQFSVSLLYFCDAAALILSTVFYLLKVALPFVGTSCRMITGITAHTTVSVV